MWTIFHTEASLGWGGQEIRVVNESLGMAARGHRVVVVAPEGSGILEKSREKGLETVALSFVRKDWPRSFRTLLSLIRDYRVDFINTHSSRDSWLATMAAKASRRKPFVVRTRHISTPVSTSFTSSLIYGRLPDMVLTTAEAIRERLIAANGVPPGKVVSIPTGIEAGRFDPAAPHRDLRDELGLPPGTPLAGTVSVLRSWKGHEYFIEAAGLLAERFPGARFIIAGEGPRREALEEFIAERGLGDKVVMLGHRDDVPDVLASLDVFVQPSYANEGVPQSVIQALAMEKAVVATDLKPFRQLITDGETGLMVGPKDPGAIAAAVERLFAHRELAERLGRAGRGLVLSKFTVEKMLDAVEEVYGRVSARRTGGAEKTSGGRAEKEGAGR